MNHSIKAQIVDEGAFAKYFLGQVETRAACTDVFERSNAFARTCSCGFNSQVDCAGKRPVILACRRPVASDSAIKDGQFSRLAAEHCCGLLEKQRADVSASLPQSDPAKLNRLAARGVAFIRRFLGVGCADQDTIRCEVKLISGNLRHS